MMTLRVTGVVLATGLCMSGLSYADEEDARAYLAGGEFTAYLQQGDSRIELMQPDTRGPSDAMVFRKFIGDLPLHGARVVVIENADGTVARAFDDSTEGLALRRGPVNVAQAAAIDTAEGFLPEAIDSVAEQVWFRVGAEAVLAWEVTTSLVDRGLPASPTHFEMVIDAATGEVLSQRQIDTKTYEPGTPEAADGVFPRIVINNTIGAAGSRAYAAPLDAVVQLGGCSGTLIAPNVVLSARHCGIGAGTLVRFGDNSNSPAFTVTVQSSILPDGNGSLLDGGDVSIHILNGSVPANIAEPMRLIDETNGLVGEVCATVGYGWNGLGSVGHGFNADGFRWGGENIIDVYGTPANSSGSNIISTDFDNGTGGANTIPSSSSAPLQFEATTAPGDSGGPVLVLSGSEWVIAGVLSGGTTNTSVYGDISWWTGTAIYRADIESAGGQFGTGLDISYPDELPDSISPDGGDTVQAQIDSAGAVLDPSTVMFHVDTGSGFVATSMSLVSGTTYLGTFPAAPCGSTVAYYVSAEDTEGEIYFAPSGGASDPNLVLATDAIVQVLSLDFEAAPGWSVQDDASLVTGTWELGVPGNWGRGDPVADFDGSGSCYVTHNANNVDVDGGPTSLISDVYDLTGAADPLISYARWFTNDDQDADRMTVEFSDDGGSSWTLVESVPGVNGWVEVEHRISDYVGLTSQFRIRVSATDNPNNSVTEGGLDALAITDPQCNSDACSIADLDADGDIDADDINAFVAAFVGGDLAADLDGSGALTADDIDVFVTAFVAGCP